ncbi:hypothetical protein OJF2_23290 [Aquisphaera giovannonii]|uniref:N-acetyltransferase domain-containing protein n=1 Tax=Aquisphaera giovannonii TaxID=406548 RepID=A0A5B9W1F3_9BACT|nr:hypothetical protein [Aquisphaera giovannonii]QEH33800.1 hypothetical protein OJF2_23290 [Aquisphaera giovannonii]
MTATRASVNAEEIVQQIELEPDVTIRRAASPADYRECQEAQRAAWGVKDNGYLVPIATMVGANLHGGIVLGAFLPDGRAVGMSFGFLGVVGDRVALYSQLTGVVPQYQSRGVGYALKMVQKYIALAEGVELIAWAFDPLQAGNAHFNLERLGARVCRYIDDMYGPRTDALNAGAPTDRVIAEWEIGPKAAPRRPVPVGVAAHLPRLIEVSRRRDGLRVPASYRPAPHAPTVLLELPRRIAELRRDQPDLAEGWRRAVREAFLASLEAGYEAVGLFRETDGAERHDYYVLDRRKPGG